MIMPAIVEVWQVGAHFKALINGVLMAPSVLRCLFFRPIRDLLNNVKFKRVLLCPYKIPLDSIRTLLALFLG